MQSKQSRSSAQKPAVAPSPATSSRGKARPRQANVALGKATIKGEVLRRAILDAAVTLFIDRGTGGTSIQDIAESLGLTRTAVYYYFKKKEDILQALSEEVTMSAKRLTSSAISRTDLDAVEALRGVVRQHATLIMAHPQGFRVIERNERELPQKHITAAESARRGIFENFRAIIERGISSGKFRAVDSDVAALSLIGMCNWTAWWFRPGGRMRVEEVADTIAEMAVQTLMREKVRANRASSVADTIELLREDLALLERHLRTAPRRAAPARIDLAVEK